MTRTWLMLALLASPTLAQAQAAKPRAQDPRTACLRESEKTHPPRTISRKLRDQIVEDCLRRRR